jgi:hypothetical protein
MKRIGITIVFNGLHHLHNQNLDEYPFDEWYFVEGASASTFCTSWCKQMPSEYHKDGHSVDGTLEYLQGKCAANPSKYKLITTDGLWDGKKNMFNAALKHISDPCWLWEVDIDEYWKPEQMLNAEKIVTNMNANAASFACNYMLTPDIIVRGEWGESPGHGYRRLWKYVPGSKFIAHEPPILENAMSMVPPYLLPRFKHLSYYFEQDVIFKTKWYSNHQNIYDNWLKIKSGETKLPVRISALFGDVPMSTDWNNSFITYF